MTFGTALLALARFVWIHSIVMWVQLSTAPSQPPFSFCLDLVYIGLATACVLVWLGTYTLQVIYCMWGKMSGNLTHLHFKILYSFCLTLLQSKFQSNRTSSRQAIARNAHWNIILTLLWLSIIWSVHYLLYMSSSASTWTHSVCNLS